MTATYVKWAVFMSFGGSCLVTGCLAGSTWLILTSIVIFAAMAIDWRDSVRGRQ